MVKLAKAGKKQGKPKKAAQPPPPEEFEESTSGEENEEELPAPPVKKVKTPQSSNKKNGKAVKKESSEEDYVEEEDEDDDSEASEEKPVPKHAAVMINKAKEESDEDEDESGEEEAMDVAPPPKANKAGMVKAQEDDEDEEDEDEDDEEEEEEDDDEDEDDKEDEEEEEEVEIAVPTKAGKRKKVEQKSVTPAKKQKSDSDESFSLFVGNLNSEKNFEELKKALNGFFTKKKLSVIDVRIGYTRKYGYVDFETKEQLEKALKFNGNKVLGLAVKLDKARSKESNTSAKRERDCRTLFVKNLPFKITQDDLKEIFDNAIDIRIPVSRDGSSSRGIAYIEFESEAAANSALEEKQGTDVDGRAIVIDFTGDKSILNVKAGQTQPNSDTLVVNNLAYSATEDTLQNIFEKASSIKILEKNGKPVGIAFVKFDSIEDAKEALENHSNTEIEGRAVRLDFSSQRHRSGDGPSKTLFVRGLSDETTEETLKEAFEGAENARIAVDRESGRSKGFGFVDFPSEEDAKLAKDAMEDGEIDGCKIMLDFARPKGDNQRGGRGGRGGGGFGRGRRGRGGFSGRGRGGRGGGRGGFGGFRGGKVTPQGKKTKFD
ncbi:nucleolin isoform X2 [Chiloscyllium plagiosum]|uniref:nucleolin isoform X2 n=1 Tax=Chiloscyllium plagiosum TaxID=36176 RepID=UPI001CB85971|nr:nucleolin isoform X2 [Chiloscyllium plagiosum]